LFLCLDCPAFCFLSFSYNTQHKHTSVPSAGLEPASSASDQQQTFALNRSATGISRFDPRTVQPVQSRHTDSAIPVHITVCRQLKYTTLRSESSDIPRVPNLV
jgi:hypothetical protein